MTDKLLSLETEIENFGKYFDNNIRCILSAPFGEGKSFFLNEFEKTRSTEYDFITLYPTNYQVCENKDIFENIKRDILLALLTLDENILQQFNKSKQDLLYKAIIGDNLKIADFLPDISVGLFKIPVARILHTIKEIIDQYKADSENSGNPINEFFDEIESGKSPIYEFDPISRIICEIISQRQNKRHKIVLVIEDLDRIDPGNIFRILNIFSAHLSQWNGYDDGLYNKFGLDKILIVCDYNNIKNIYHHLYGEKTDFTGYISKFSPNKVFSYSLRTRMTEYMCDTIDSFLNNRPLSKILASEIIAKSNGGDNHYIYNFRNIIELIRHSVDLIDDGDLYFPLKQSDQEDSKLHILKNIPMLMFLAICKQFSISYEELLTSDRNSGIDMSSVLFNLTALFYFKERKKNETVYFDGKHYYIPLNDYLKDHFNGDSVELDVEDRKINGIKYYPTNMLYYSRINYISVLKKYEKNILNIPLI